MSAERARLPFVVLDCLLLAAIACLSLFLLVQFWSMGQEWWRSHPRPGVQVHQQFVGQLGTEEGSAPLVLDYLLYLPPHYEPSHS